MNTLTRMLNLLRASSSIQSIVHPAYAELHQAANRADSLWRARDRSRLD